MEAGAHTVSRETHKRPRHAHVEGLHKKRRASESKPPKLVHYLKDSVLSCSDEDSRPPDLLPEVIVTRRKNNREKRRRDAQLCDEEQEFYGFETLDIELSGKAFESLQKFSYVKQKSCRIEDIHVDYSDILQKLHNLNSRVETRKNISQAEIQKKWFQELQDSHKKSVKKTSNCVVKLPRLLSGCGVREHMDSLVSVREGHQTGGCHREEQAENNGPVEPTLGATSEPSAVSRHTLCSRQAASRGENNDADWVYAMPSEVSTGKEEVEYMDGKLILTFETEADLEEFTRRDDEYRRAMFYFSPLPYIVPTKTTDITKIKGWRTKKFVVNSDEDTLNDEDLEVNDELESLRNEQEALVRRLNSSSDDLENVHSVISSVTDELLDVEEVHENEEDDVSLAVHCYIEQSVNSNLNSMENNLGEESETSRKKRVCSTQSLSNRSDTNACNVEKQKLLGNPKDCKSQTSKNTSKKYSPPSKLVDSATPRKRLRTEHRLQEKALTNEMNIHCEPSNSKTAHDDSLKTDNDMSFIVGIKSNVSVADDKSEITKEEMDPTAPFISRDLDYYLSANPAPMLKFPSDGDSCLTVVSESSSSSSHKKSESKLSNIQAKSSKYSGKQKGLQNAKNLSSADKSENTLYLPRVGVNASTESDSIPRTHYRHAVKALQICKNNIAVQSKDNMKYVLSDKRKNLDYKSQPAQTRKRINRKSRKNLKKLARVMKMWGSRSVMEKKSLIIKKKALLSEKNHKQTINNTHKLRKRNEIMKRKLNAVNLLPSKLVKTRLLSPIEPRKTARRKEKKKFIEAVKKVKSELVGRFAAVKECRIVMHTLVGRPMQDIEVKQLYKIRGDSWNVDRQWAEFSASVVTSRTVPQVRRHKFQFKVPFETMLLSKLINQQDIDAHSEGNAVIQVIDNKPSKEKDHSIAEVTRVVNELVNCVVNHEVQDLIILPDPDYDPTIIPPSLANKTVCSEKKKCVSIARELHRLDVNFIEMDTKSDPEEAASESGKACNKPYCTLGCVCGSISSAGSVTGFTEHCRRVECMFECVCDQIKNERIGTEGRGGVADKPSIIPPSTVMRLQDESSRHLAKVEKQFKHTVIKAKDEMIVVSVGGSSRRKREIKLPGRFKDSVLGKEFLAAELKILSCSEDCFDVLEKDDQDVNFPLRKQKPLVVNEKPSVRDCTVCLTRLRGTSDMLSSCVVQDYREHASETSDKNSLHTVETKHHEEKSNAWRQSGSRNVAKKSTAIGGILSHGKLGCMQKIGKMDRWVKSRKKVKHAVVTPETSVKSSGKEESISLQLQKAISTNKTMQKDKVRSKANSDLFKIVSVGSMRVEDFESQTIPETFVSSISKSLSVVKANDNIEIEDFQSPSTNQSSVIKYSHLKDWDKPLVMLEHTDYSFGSNVKDDIIQLYTLLNCMYSEKSDVISKKVIYVGSLHALRHFHSIGRIFYWLYRTDKIPVTRVLATLTDEKPNKNCMKLNYVEVTYNDTLPQIVKLTASSIIDSSLTKLKYVGVFVSDGSNTYELIGTMTTSDLKKWTWKRHYDCAMLQCFLLKAGFDPFNNKYLAKPFHPFRWYMIAMNKSFAELVIEGYIFPYIRLYSLVEKCRKEQIDYALHFNLFGRSEMEKRYDWKYKFGIYGSAKYYEQIFIGPFDLEEPANVYLYRKSSDGTVYPLAQNEKCCRWVYASVNHMQIFKASCSSSKNAVVGDRKEPPSTEASERQEPPDNAQASGAVGQEQERNASANCEGASEEKKASTSDGGGRLTPGEVRKHNESIMDIIEEMLNNRQCRSEDLVSGRDGKKLPQQDVDCSEDGASLLPGKGLQPLTLKQFQQFEALMLVPSISGLGFINCCYQSSCIRLMHSGFEESPTFNSVHTAGKWINRFLRSKVKFVPPSLELVWSIHMASARNALPPLNLKAIKRKGYVLTPKGLKRDKVALKQAKSKVALHLHKKATLTFHFGVLTSHLVRGKQAVQRRTLLKMARREIKEEEDKTCSLDKVYSEIHDIRQEKVAKILQLVKGLSPMERREQLNQVNQILQKQDPVITVDDDDDESSSAYEPEYCDNSDTDDFLESSDEGEEEEDNDIIMVASVPVAGKSLRAQRGSSAVHDRTPQVDNSAIGTVRAAGTNSAASSSATVQEPVSQAGSTLRREKNLKFVRSLKTIPSLTMKAMSNVENYVGTSSPSTSSAGLSYKLSSVISPNRNRINVAVDDKDIYSLEHSSQKSQSLLKPIFNTLSERLGEKFQCILKNPPTQVSPRDQQLKTVPQSTLCTVDGSSARTCADSKPPNCPNLTPKLGSTPQGASPSSSDRESFAKKPFSILTIQGFDKEDVNKKPLVIVSPLGQDIFQSKEKEDLAKKSLLMFSSSTKIGSQSQEKEDVSWKPLVVVPPLSQNCSQGKDKEDGTKKPVVIVSPLAKIEEKEDCSKKSINVTLPSPDSGKEDVLKKPVVVVSPSSQNCSQGSPDKTKVLQLLQSSSGSSLQAKIQGKVVKFQPLHDICIVVSSSGQKTLIKGQSGGKNSLLKSAIQLPIGGNLSNVPTSPANVTEVATDVVAVDTPPASNVRVTSPSKSEVCTENRESPVSSVDARELVARTNTSPSPPSPDRRSSLSPVLVIDD